MKFLAVLAGALALSTSAHAATVYDAFASFNGVQGAGGFSYYKIAGPGSPGGPLTAPSGACIVTATYCLQDGGALPGVYKSLVGGQEASYTIPTDQLLVHPGSANAIGVLFQAPTAGEYDFTLTANILDRSPTGIALIRLTNIGGVVDSGLLATLGSANLSFTGSGTITLGKDDLIGFIVNPGGNYSNDSTGVNFVLTARDGPGVVPEPGAWALMILGFGGVGGMLRRRRWAAVAG